MVKKEELCERRKREKCVVTTAADSFEMVTTTFELIEQGRDRKLSGDMTTVDPHGPIFESTARYVLVCPRLPRSLSLRAWNMLVTCFLALIYSYKGKVLLSVVTVIPTTTR